MNNHFASNIFKKIGLSLALIMGGVITLGIIVILFFALVNRAFFEPATIINDTSKGYRISLFGSGDPLDGGFILSKDFELEPNAKRVFRERIDCVMVEDLKTDEVLSLGLPEPAGDKTVTYKLSTLIADKNWCWDLKKLEVDRLYHCNKEKCY